MPRAKTPKPRVHYPSTPYARDTLSHALQVFADGVAHDKLGAAQFKKALAKMPKMDEEQKDKLFGAVFGIQVQAPLVALEGMIALFETYGVDPGWLMWSEHAFHENCVFRSECETPRYMKLVDKFGHLLENHVDNGNRWYMEYRRNFVPAKTGCVLRWKNGNKVRVVAATNVVFE